MQGRPTSNPRAFAQALGAHAIWGSMPIYLLLVHRVPALEYVAWRTLFTLPICLLAVAWTRSGKELRAVLSSRRTVMTLMASAALIAVNWYGYVWAIQQEKIYAASVGYYILPLLMMLFGMLFLGERLSKVQWLAVVLAGAGVAALAAGALTTLWLSLMLGVSFGIYGLLRKTVNAGPLVGLTVETLLLMPLVGVALFWLETHQGLAIGRDGLETLGILLGGPMTAVPLLLFASAARALPYTVVGFLQFISPTIVFLLGLFVFGEPLKPAQLACFVAIWVAAGLFTRELLRGKKPAASPEPAV